MELSMDNMDIIAGGILAIMLALFMLTVIVTLFALSHRIRLLSNEIYRIEKQVSDYIDELSRSESDKLEIEHKVHQDGVISSVLQVINLTKTTYTTPYGGLYEAKQKSNREHYGLWIVRYADGYRGY